MSVIVQHALDYVSQLKIEPGRYRMTRDLNGTIYTDLFGFFTRYLVNDPYHTGERDVFIERVLDHQDEQTGNWRTEAREVSSALHDSDHVNRQLTTFALNALVTLDVQPRHPLHFTDEWKRPGYIESYLDSLDWRHNTWNSGSRAMFIAIILTYLADFEADDRARQALNDWFDWHDRSARPGSGFWGKSYHADWYIGMGGAAHQYLLYDYHKRQPPHLERAVQQILRMQYYDGRYWPLYGSGSCNELDAMQILLVGHRHLPTYREQIEAAARKIITFTLGTQNADGGFCWAPRRWFVWGDILRSLPVTGNPVTMIWNLQKQAIAHIKRNDMRARTAWVDGQHTIQTSSLFDTWFRLLALAEAAQVVSDNRLDGITFQPLKLAGWGYF